MVWNKKEIEIHVKTAKLLEKIKDEAFEIIRKNENVDEHIVQEFIHLRFKEEGLISTGPQIVAFNASAAVPHYYPTKNNSRKLVRDSLVLIDIWARFREGHSPYVDMTWTGYYGKVRKDVQKVFDVALAARDGAINHLRKCLKMKKIPSGKEIDDVAVMVIQKAGFGKYILHRTGHCIGFASPHGNGRNLNQTNNFPLLKNLGYTIEPGVYVKGLCGVRSEIDFYIDEHYNLILTTNLQRKLVKI